MPARALPDLDVSDGAESGAPVAPVPVTNIAIEMELPHGLVTTLPRVPAFAALREGRARGGVLTLIWLDDSEGSLAAQGILVEQGPRDAVSLIRALPDLCAGWHPAAPAVRAGPPPASMEAEAPLVALAAFEGRRLTYRLSDPSGPISATLLQGKLRAVTAERQVARLTLEGPASGVLALAQAIATALPAIPSSASLAEVGRALALGSAARPSARGAPDLSGAESVDDALARATGHLSAIVLELAREVTPDAGPELVHQMRVALRRLRSLLKLVRKAADGPAPLVLAGGLKQLLEYLGPARDWDVFTGGICRALSEALPDDRPIAALRKAAEARRQAAYDALTTFLASPGYRVIALQMVGFSATRAWREAASPAGQALLAAPFDTFAGHIVMRRWKGLARDGAAMARMDAPRLHAMRLDAKRVRYAVELLAPLYPQRRTRRFQARLAQLQEALGLANDATVAAELAKSLMSRQAGRAYAIGVVVGWAQARAAATRRKAERAWRRLDASGPFW